MPRKKIKPIDYLEKLRKLRDSGLHERTQPNRNIYELDKLQTIDERVKQIFNFTERPKKQEGKMLFFVMYDIESNKVRNYVVKYLEKQGCVRIQKSIFLANLEVSVYDEIRNDLAEVQSLYENDDSILVVPISTDYLRSMKIIGQSINIDIITRSKNTLFF